MTVVHVLTEPPVNQNTAAFLSPMIWNAEQLRRRGIRLRLFYRPEPALKSCDILLVSSKIWPGPWEVQRDRALALLAELRRGPQLVYFDRSSTPGSILGDVLAHVDGYTKTSMYADRSLYLRRVYGGRLFSEYYRDASRVDDADDPYTPPALKAEEVARVQVAWNTGLTSYSLSGPRRASLYRFLPARTLFSPPRRLHSPLTARPVAVSCRMGVTYRYATVAHQRRRMAEILASHRRTERISKAAYFRELAASRVVASPFGYSEINYKDFETFVCGAALLKPNMDHLETWPNYFVPGQTYLSHRWDLSDVEAQLAEAEANPDMRLAVAQRAQDLYRWHVAHPDGGEAFVERFARLIGAP